jgi:predicted RNase H-like HicB family nuclease
MTQTYTALIQQSDGWWIGRIQEIPGINCQERTREELLDSIKSALEDILEINRQEAMRRIENGYQAVPISI